jgi:hypothetical protein
MYSQPARHPRAGIAVGLAILATWLGAFGFAAATAEPGDSARPAPTTQR